MNTPSFFPFAEDIEALFREFRSSKEGLTNAEARERLVTTGSNRLPVASERLAKGRIFLSQWKNPLILILLFAGVASGLLREWGDMIIILVTATINVVIGFIQEYKANAALERLQSMVEYKALVIRGGKNEYLKSEDLVPGDIVVITAGDKVQADGRCIEAVQLEINEAPLTGESVPVKKQTNTISATAGLADRKNMLYRGTTVVAGRGLMIVTGTGTQTELGRIATLVKETNEGETPLQVQLGRLSRILGFVVLVIAVGIILLGLLGRHRAYSIFELMQIAVAVAVAAIPEGLAISLTVMLAIGMQQILKRKALVRRLLAAETLGSVNVICTDKTGTLTEGIMQVTDIVTASENIGPRQLTSLQKEDRERHPEIWLALRIGALCNDAVLQKSQEKGESWSGDTTEIALSSLGVHLGLVRHELEGILPRVSEVPFSSDHKLMATVHGIDHEWFWYVKGAPEVLLARATKYEKHGVQIVLSEKERQWWRDEEMRMGKQGLRVLGLAYYISRTTPSQNVTEKDVHDLIFVGLVGISDPVRADVAETIQRARNAGIRTIMVTGDHAYTAATVAASLWLSRPTEVIDGPKLQQMNDAELAEAVKHTSIFARVSPEHKIRIVNAVKADGAVVAMTGDGVNDAPALKAADIGVAVGSGTDVAKEVADLVLLNDSFTTIVDSVEEGRRVYENIKKVVLYLLGGSLAAVFLVIGSLIFGLPLALLPAQILWINIIQETFPTMALAFDRGDENNMTDPPRAKSQSLFDRPMLIIIGTFTLITNVVLFALFWHILRQTNNVDLARSVVFAGLGVGALFYIYTIRSLRRPVWKMSFFDNRHLTAAVGGGVLALIASIYFPPLQWLLGTVALGWKAWVLVIGFGLLNAAIIELVKRVLIRPKKKI